MISPQIGSKIHFAQNGETVETVTVANTAAGKPAGSVLTTWRELGCVKECAPNLNRISGTVSRCFNATSGLFEDNVTRGERTELSYVITLQNIDDLIIALAHGDNGVDGSDNYTPDSNPFALGWLHCQNYIGTTVNNLLFAWCELRFTGNLQMSETPTEAQVTAKIIAPASDTSNQGTTYDQFAG